MLLSRSGFWSLTSQREEKSQPDSAPALSSAHRASRSPVRTEKEPRSDLATGKGSSRPKPDAHYRGPGFCPQPSLTLLLPTFWQGICQLFIFAVGLRPGKRRGGQPGTRRRSSRRPSPLDSAALGPHSSGAPKDSQCHHLIGQTVTPLAPSPSGDSLLAQTRATRQEVNRWADQFLTWVPHKGHNSGSRHRSLPLSSQRWFCSQSRSSIPRLGSQYSP
jgi:hypothetical protein